MNKNEQILQIRIGQISVVVVIITLIHSLYILNVEEKRIKNEPTISRLESAKQNLINRIIILIVTVIFLLMEVKNFIEFQNGRVTKEDIIKQKARIVIFILAFLSVLIDVILGINNYYNLKKRNMV